MDPNKLLTVAEVARLRGKTESRIRQLCSSGELPAEQYGRTWLVRRRDAERFEFKPRGRQPKIA